MHPPPKTHTQSAPRDDDDDLDDDLADQLVRDFHFGGGHVPEGPSSGQGQGSTLQGQHDTHTHAHGEMMHGEGIASTRPRTKKEVMQELMAKSKAHKAARQLQHEQDDRVVEELNETLQQLIEDRKLAALFRPAGQKMYVFVYCGVCMLGIVCGVVCVCVCVCVCVWCLCAVPVHHNNYADTAMHDTTMHDMRNPLTHTSPPFPLFIHPPHFIHPPFHSFPP